MRAPGDATEDVPVTDGEPTRPSAASWVWVTAAWILVGIPLVWGIVQTLRTAIRMF